MSATFNKIKEVDRSKLEGNALKAYDALKEETDNFDLDTAVALNLDDDVERLARKIKEKFPQALKEKNPIRKAVEKRQAEAKKKKTAAKKKPKKKAKKKSKPKSSSSKTGSFAKLRSQIAKREGISYKDALSLAKKEYAEAKEEAAAQDRQKRSKRIEKFKKQYQGKGLRKDVIDAEKDAKQPALPEGKRTSKNGKIYYEYRDNRTDQRQPQPSDYPRLNRGGDVAAAEVIYPTEIIKGLMAKGGDISKVSKAQLESELSNNLRNLRDLQEVYSRTGNEVFKKQIRPLAERNEVIVDELKSRDPKFDITKYAKGGEVSDDEYADYLNEAMSYLDYEDDEYIIGGENRADEYFGRYGDALREYDPIAFEVGRADYEREINYAKGGKVEKYIIVRGTKESEKYYYQKGTNEYNYKWLRSKQDATIFDNIKQAEKAADESDGDIEILGTYAKGGKFPSDKIGQIDKFLSESDDSQIRKPLQKVREKLTNKIKLNDKDISLLESVGIDTYKMAKGGKLSDKKMKRGASKEYYGYFRGYTPNTTQYMLLDDNYAAIVTKYRNSDVDDAYDIYDDKFHFRGSASGIRQGESGKQKVSLRKADFEKAKSFKDLYTNKKREMSMAMMRAKGGNITHE